MNAYEEKVALKKARYAQMAKELQGKSDALAKMDSRTAVDRAVELGKKAQFFREREKTYGEAQISFADPDAIKKLESRLNSDCSAANRSRIRKRIRNLREMEKICTLEERHKKFTYREDTDEKRVMFFFSGSPDWTTKNIIKKYAFKWSQGRVAWVRLLTPAGITAGRAARDELLDLEQD